MHNFRLSQAQNVKKATLTISDFTVCTIEPTLFKNEIIRVLDDLFIPLYDTNLSKLIVSYVPFEFNVWNDEDLLFDEFCFYASIYFEFEPENPNESMSVNLTFTPLHVMFRNSEHMHEKFGAIKFPIDNQPHNYLICTDGLCALQIKNQTFNYLASDYRKRTIWKSVAEFTKTPLVFERLNVYNSIKKKTLCELFGTFWT
jgi:hypothetical protein